MRSSTSSSEGAAVRPARKRDIATLLGILVLIALAFEAFTRYGVARLSRVTSRVETEYEASLKIRRGAKGQVLLLGNSLLDAGLNMPQVREAFAPDWEVTRLIIEQTNYQDWYFGMRRLFAEGAQPDVVVLCLTARNLVSSGVRGDYFAHYMLQPSDLSAAARKLDLHPTETANMLFANLSHFYGMRSEIRKVLMGRLMPGTRSLMALLTNTSNAALQDEQVWNAAKTRLHEYKEITSAHGIKFVFIMPPLLGDDKSGIVIRAGAAGGVPVVAIPSGVLSRRHFSDGYHLAEPGAAIYTAKLIPLLRKVVEELMPQHFQTRVGL